MGYEIAINKAWEALLKLSPEGQSRVSFLGDEYSVDPQTKKVLSLSCNVAAKDFTAILILHYLAAKVRGLPGLSGRWLTFRELSGVEGYEAAFRKRVIEPILNKYGKKPEALLDNLARLKAEKAQQGDIGIVLEAFEGVPALITLWKGDQEFGPEANLLFDANISGIFCTEDIVVLAGLVAGRL